MHCMNAVLRFATFMQGNSIGMSGPCLCMHAVLGLEHFRVVESFQRFLTGCDAMRRGIGNLQPEQMIETRDIMEAALLPFRMSSNACPTRITIRNAVVPS